MELPVQYKIRLDTPVRTALTSLKLNLDQQAEAAGNRKSDLHSILISKIIKLVKTREHIKLLGLDRAINDVYGQPQGTKDAVRISIRIKDPILLSALQDAADAADRPIPAIIYSLIRHIAINETAFQKPRLLRI